MIRDMHFDTGQVVRGWVALLEQMPELEGGLRRACNWLIDTADAQTGRLLVPHLISRIVNNLNGLELKIYSVRNAKSVHPSCHVRFVALLEKR